jgi:hypothetical protein
MKRNALFTYNIFKIMEKRESIKESELKEQVVKPVEELNKGQQRPTSRSERFEIGWVLW